MRVHATSAMVSALLGMSAVRAPAAAPLDLRACADPAPQAGLESKPDTRIYRKSGTWRQFHSDSALVEGQRRRYILVGIAEDPRGGEWLERMAAPLNDRVDPEPSGPGTPDR
jgi:hypothetical protein